MNRKKSSGTPLLVYKFYIHALIYLYMYLRYYVYLDILAGPLSLLLYIPVLIYIFIYLRCYATVSTLFFSPPFPRHTSLQRR